MSLLFCHPTWVIALSNGLLFALIALGYSLVFSVLGLINFAHGDVFMLAALGCWLAMAAMPPQVWHTVWLWPTLALLAMGSAAFGAALNVAINRFVYKPLRHGSALSPLVAALGTSLVLQNIGLLLGGLPIAGGSQAAAAPKTFLQPLSFAPLRLCGRSLGLSAREALVIASALLALALLHLLLSRSALGRAMRAVAQDPVAAALMGIDAERTIRHAFALAGALAGVAALVFGLYVGTVHYQMGFANGLYAFSAAVCGGLGSLGGAVLGALGLGVLRAAADVWLGGQWQPAVVFGVLLLVLVWRPQGLLGRGPEKV